MDKQRMSNILSSVQMSPRDRKDFIEELSKLGQGGAGGGGGNVHELKSYIHTDDGINYKFSYQGDNLEGVPENSILCMNVYTNMGEGLTKFSQAYLQNKTFPTPNLSDDNGYVFEFSINMGQALTFRCFVNPFNDTQTDNAITVEPITNIVIYEKNYNPLLYDYYMMAFSMGFSVTICTESSLFIKMVGFSTSGSSIYGIYGAHISCTDMGINTIVAGLSEDGLHVYEDTLPFKGNGYLTNINLHLTNVSSSNKTAISGLSLTEDYTCQLALANKTLLGTYYNGTFTAFSEGKIVRYDVDSNGNVTQDLSINPELIGTVAKLEVGDADDICQRNLELINMAITQAGANHFDVDIDYGVGSATFTQGLADDAIAGTATIIVATGYVTKYNLYGNGKVEKVGNDIDLFALEARIAALEGA